MSNPIGPANRTDDDWKLIFQELENQSDRGAGIVAAAIVEEHLTKSLQCRLRLTKTIEERIFSIDRGGFASEFASKVDLAFCVGLIQQTILNDLRLIAKIRNRFAHRVEPLQFSDGEISAWCDTLNNNILGSTNPRDQ
jgi:mannitol operon repressor